MSPKPEKVTSEVCAFFDEGERKNKRLKGCMRKIANGRFGTMHPLGNTKNGEGVSRGAPSSGGERKLGRRKTERECRGRGKNSLLGPW